MLSAVQLAAASACSGAAPLSARDQYWQQDIAYLARKLPMVRAAGLGTVPRQAWDAVAARLEADVPQLTDGQILVRIAQMVAMLRDDKTQLIFPVGPFYELDAQWVGGGLYLPAVPDADRALLGARLLAVDGHPIAWVMARAATITGAEDAQLRSNFEVGVLDDGDLLQWLGVTTSATDEVLTVTTAAGRLESVRVTAVPGSQAFITWPLWFANHMPGIAYVPLPLYEQNWTRPYWMQILPGQHAVYLRYNECVAGAGFQQLAVRALALLTAHPDYRLVIDLRDNPGGTSTPLQSVAGQIAASPALRTRGRIIGLVNQFTNSGATIDARMLRQAGAVLIGQPPADPIDEWGGWRPFRLPWPGSTFQVVYTTRILNPTRTPMGIPDITVKPVLAQILTGNDPVLTAALAYQPAD